MLARFIETPRENTLTAAVFSHLLHLPAGMFWEILRKSCYTDQLPNDAGEPLHVDPWPSWSAEGTNNCSRVIPDIFIRFDEFDLIIEAKRRDDWMQRRTQWEDQLAAYANEYGSDRKPVRMIALGGIHKNEDDEVRCRWQPTTDQGKPVASLEIICPVHMCRWTWLLDQSLRLLRDWQCSPERDPQTVAHCRILQDVIALFSVHGFSAGRWFAEFVHAPQQLGRPIAAHPEVFRLSGR